MDYQPRLPFNKSGSQSPGSTSSSSTGSNATAKIGNSTRSRSINGSSKRHLNVNLKDHCILCLQSEDVTVIHQLLTTNPKGLFNFQPLVYYLTAIDPTDKAQQSEMLKTHKYFPVLANLPPMCVQCYGILGEMYRLHTQLVDIQVRIQKQIALARRIVKYTAKEDSRVATQRTTVRSQLFRKMGVGMKSLLGRDEMESLRYFLENFHGLIIDAEDKFIFPCPPPPPDPNSGTSPRPPPSLPDLMNFSYPVQFTAPSASSSCPPIPFNEFYTQPPLALQSGATDYNQFQYNLSNPFPHQTFSSSPSHVHSQSLSSTLKRVPFVLSKQTSTQSPIITAVTSSAAQNMTTTRTPSGPPDSRYSQYPHPSKVPSLPVKKSHADKQSEGSGSTGEVILVSGIDHRLQYEVEGEDDEDAVNVAIYVKNEVEVDEGTNGQISNNTHNEQNNDHNHWEEHEEPHIKIIVEPDDDADDVDNNCYISSGERPRPLIDTRSRFSQFNQPSRFFTEEDPISCRKGVARDSNDFTCEICGKQCVGGTALLRHVREIHNNKRRRISKTTEPSTPLEEKGPDG